MHRGLPQYKINEIYQKVTHMSEAELEENPSLRLIQADKALEILHRQH
jgi:hypothetical protein